MRHRVIRTAVCVVAALCIAAAAAHAQTGCKEEPNRKLGAGHWTGTFDETMAAHGGKLNMRMQIHQHGTLSFRVTDDGKLTEFQGEYQSESSSAMDVDETSGRGNLSSSAELSLSEDGPTGSDRFKADGQIRLRNNIRARVDTATAAKTQSATGSVELTFAVTSSSCDSGRGVVSSPGIDRMRDSWKKQGLTITDDAPGTFKVTNDTLSERAKDVRGKIKSALSSCPSFLSDTEKCLPAANQILDSIKREGDQELRNCLFHIWSEEVVTASGKWVDQAAQIFNENAMGKTSACFMQPYIAKSMKVLRWFELLVESQCAQVAKQKELFDAVIKLNNSYEQRVTKGETRREVYGLPCAATASDPAQAKAIQQYLDMVYKTLGLTPPTPPVVR